MMIYEKITPMNICFAIDDKFTQHLAVTVSSILENKNPDDSLNFYIIETDLSEQNKKKLLKFKKEKINIEFITVDSSFCKSFSLNSCGFISEATFNRLLIPDLFKTQDRILYLDSDIVVLSSLSELYNKDFENNLILGASDFEEEEHKKRLNLDKYLNAGVLLLNLEKIRNENYQNEFVEYYKNNQDKIIYNDQDIINGTFNGRTGYVEQTWNEPVWFKSRHSQKDLEKIHILHYIACDKPWIPFAQTEFKDIYFKYLKKTPFKKYKIKYDLYIFKETFLHKILEFHPLPPPVFRR